MGPARAAPLAAATIEGMTEPTDPCPSGVCGADAPPLVGSVLTGTGMTLRQAAAALDAGETPQLSDVQRRVVEQWVETQAHVK